MTIALVVPATAVAAEKQSTIDVAAARVTAENQLVARGIDPGTAVFQIGTRNYAGPECPGSEWNCTSAATVVQIASGLALSSVNRVGQCSKSACTITQTNDGGVNEARCVQRASASAQIQTCLIVQTNTTGRNTAFIAQSITQSQAVGAQGAEQRATVVQGTVTGTNESAIHQEIEQREASELNGAGAITQAQEAHQRADVCQGGTSPCFAPSNGENVSSVAQSNVQRAQVHFGKGSSGAITQQQNTDPNSGQAIGALPKSTAIVSQRSVGSTNTSGLRQFNRQIASVHDGAENDDEDLSSPGPFAGTVVQRQGVTGAICPAGGLCGYVAQDSTGIQRALERQDELQKLEAPPGATQVQFGPEFCCATQTGGNLANVNDITQVKVQLHTSSITVGKIQGHCESSPAGCNVHQTLTQNLTTKSNSCNGSTCNPTIVCFTGPTEGGGDRTVCSTGTAAGPLPPPSTGSPTLLSVLTDASTQLCELIAPRWLAERSANL